MRDKIDKKLDVRIICRDMMKQESLDVLVGLGFPKEAFRFQPACHNKTIIIDGKTVAFGSHNWSNEGIKTNRDASLIFDDEKIAAYLAEVYDYDWNTLATAHPTKARPRGQGGRGDTGRLQSGRFLLRLGMASEVGRDFGRRLAARLELFVERGRASDYSAR